MVGSFISEPFAMMNSVQAFVAALALLPASSILVDAFSTSSAGSSSRGTVAAFSFSPSASAASTRSESSWMSSAARAASSARFFSSTSFFSCSFLRVSTMVSMRFFACSKPFSASIFRAGNCAPVLPSSSLSVSCSLVSRTTMFSGVAILTSPTILLMDKMALCSFLLFSSTATLCFMASSFAFFSACCLFCISSCFFLS
mmetsp:Transcript_75734/g.136603  ORF Transcript_75734/g.136603 Transcript_75734/m.136603 type:complete len:200 (+) Transcript_75734:1812-2411(+)